METVCEVPRNYRVLEIVGTLFKAKFLIATLPRITAFGVAGIWLLTFSFWAHAWVVLVRNGQEQPTPDALEQHLNYDDKRIDELRGDIASRLDRLESSRDQRMQQGDDRYKSISVRLDSVTHDVTFIYGGGIIGTGLVTLLLTLNVVKINNAERRLRETPPANILKEDYEQLAVLLEHMRRQRDRENRGATRDKGRG